ncbi:unnamed protein product, partial [Didymodactylos carnosus]
IKFKLPGITSFNNFEFDASSIRVHRAWQIGDGKKLLKKDLLRQTPKISILDCVKSPYCNDWSNSKETTRPEASKEETENANDEPSNTIVYECNQEGCTQAFIRYQNFINHLLIGKHSIKEEKLNLTDAAMKTYHSKLETVDNRQMVSLLLEMST